MPFFDKLVIPEFFVLILVFPLNGMINYTLYHGCVKYIVFFFYTLQNSFSFDPFVFKNCVIFLTALVNSNTEPT